MINKKIRANPFKLVFIRGYFICYKFMKLKIFTILLISLSLLLSVSAQDKNKSQPELTVVKIEDAPPTVETPAPQKPANGSLFTDSATNGNLLADFKARRVGDLVFVDIVESSEATVESSAKRNRDSGTLAGIGTVAGALPVPGAAVAGTIVGALGVRKYDGKGSTQRNSDVRARITARVVEVLPNGDLRIEALKLVRINKETEQVAVTGIVRPSDLNSDNAVQTVSIGDLRVEFNGKGVASKDNAPGWLYRLFDKVSPF
jgi:flagellar L-ring protein precursor FlgH